MSAISERILARTMRTDACWLWLGARCTKGYGQISELGSLVLVHRAMYEAHHGPIPTGKVIDHTCHDPAVCVGGPCVHRACVNPAHLTATTNEQNLARQSPAAKTHCLRGHEYTDANTGRSNGSRYCRACRRGAMDRRNERIGHLSEAAAIRQWARDAGFTVGTRGRLGRDVTDAYASARAAA